MQIKLKVELCRPQPEQTDEEIVWNGERGCHCHVPKPESLQLYSDPRIKLFQETFIMHLSVIMINE